MEENILDLNKQAIPGMSCASAWHVQSPRVVIRRIEDPGPNALVAVEELHLSYHSSENLPFTIYIYISLSLSDGNLTKYMANQMRATGRSSGPGPSRPVTLG